MKPSYNYTVAESHKGKIYIPYLGIEIKGYATLFSAIIGFFTIVVVISFPLSFILGSNSYFVGIAIATCITTIVITYANEINNQTGRTKLKEFYYLNMKNYRYIYDSNGVKHYLHPKKKGVIFVNAYRSNTRIR